MTANISLAPEVVANFWKWVDKRDDGCWYWKGWTTPAGYGGFVAKQKKTMAHRFSYLLLRGAIPRHLWVLHRCDNRLCCNPDHLFLGTAKDNTSDCINKGRFKVLPGSGNHQAKLKDEDIPKIRERYRSGGISMKRLGEEFSVCSSVIHHVVHGITWKHI